MKNVYFICLLLLFSIVIKAQNELGFEFDYARFNYDSTSVYLEFYYKLNSRFITTVPTSNDSLIETIVHIEIKNSETNSFFIDKDWKIQNIIHANQKDSLINSSTGVLGFVVPEGNYLLKVIARDSKNPSFTKSISETITIKPYSPSKYSISDIQLAQNIKKDDADSTSIFYKNTMEIFPNPTILYTFKLPVLFYYSELYNLKLGNKDSTFSLQKLLYNNDGKVMYQNTKTIMQATSPVVEYGVINLSKYPTDSYLLKLSLIDPVTNHAYYSEKRFYLYNPNVVNNTKSDNVNSDVIGSEYHVFNVDECDKMFSEAKYIATRDEINQYKKLNSLKAKQEFLYHFWKGRDPNPETPQNEFSQEYMKRVEEANAKFSRLKKEGYLTDRGRVLLLYGTPDQKDYFPNDHDKKPYEIWFYNSIEGGVTFVFADFSGFGNYEQVHSTKQGEVQDENWQSRVSQ